MIGTSSSDGITVFPTASYLSCPHCPSEVQHAANNAAAGALSNLGFTLSPKL